jgi:mono/diheme cytochrome c family protein
MSRVACAAISLLLGAITLVISASSPAFGQGAAASREAAPAESAAASPVAAQIPGERLFLKKCGLCHLEGGTGTLMLAWRLGQDRSLLRRRADLDASYVKLIVRSGLRSMPALTRVEVTDAALADIAAYLARGPAK